MISTSSKSVCMKALGMSTVTRTFLPSFDERSRPFGWENLRLLSLYICAIFCSIDASSLRGYSAFARETWGTDIEANVCRFSSPVDVKIGLTTSMTCRFYISLWTASISRCLKHFESLVSQSLRATRVRECTNSSIEVHLLWEPTPFDSLSVIVHIFLKIF